MALFKTGLFLFFPFLLFSQEVRTNEKGEKIIVYPDGTWKYFNETTDDPFATNESPGLPANTPPPDLTPREKEEWYDRKAQEEAIRYAENLNADAAQLEKYAYDTKLQRIFLEEELTDMRNREQAFTAGEIRETERKLDLARRRETMANQLQLDARALADEAERAIVLSRAKREKALEKIQEGKATIDAKKELLAALEIVPEEIQGSSPNTKPPAALPQTDVYINPPKQACVLTFDGVDDFTGKKRRDVKSQILFTYTSPELKSYMKDREYITCMGYLTGLDDGYNFLTLEFRIANKNAPSAFGGIPTNSILSVKLMNGEMVRLVNNKQDAGSYNALDDTYTYRAQYHISSTTERILRSSEVDKVRVIWATGYEDYEVFELDFFIHQFDCLKK